jgi:GTP-binding protein EngB required for normal cell division
MATHGEPKLTDWYKRSARPLIAEHAPDRLEGFDREHEALLKLATLAAPDFPVCFLGNSGVGKSTLLNALAGDTRTIVPAGGVGPLTAQALTVRFASRPLLVVNYHPLQSLWRHIWALERGYEAEAKARGENLPEIPTDDAIPFEKDEAGPEEVDGDGEQETVQQAFRKTAQLIVTGAQDGDHDIPYLIDSLREAAGKRRAFGTSPKPEDKERIARVSSALAFAKEKRRFTLDGAASEAEVMAGVKDHASGFLAPLIRELVVGWDAGMLRDGLCLVDLPGVGIAGDVYREVTRSWIREKAQAVVLVVDHRGVTESVAELLRKSEFLNRLLYSADDPASDPALMVAVTKIDDIASTRYSENKSKKKREHFAEVCQEIDARVRSQIKEQLAAVWASDRGPSKLRQQVIENILKSLQVFPVSAVEYRKLLAADDDDRSFLSEASQSNVPQMAKALETMAKERVSQRKQRLRSASDTFRERLTTTLGVVAAQWSSDARAGEEAERLREDLELFIKPLREELLVRQGQYRAFLKKGVPQRIEDLVATASLTAQQEIDGYLLKLGYAHWGTLRASVRRGGQFSGATYIDLPREFALRLEEPIASAWTKQILRDIRAETKGYAGDCAELVSRVVEWARDQGARVQPQLVEAQYEAVKADAKQLEAVGREMVNELRDEARVQLIETIEGPIRVGCQQFVAQHADVGPGVKNRILYLFRDLAKKVAAVGTKPATQILTKLFRDVEREISATLEAHPDPLAMASEAIVSSQEAYLRRSDAQRRKKVLAEVGAAIEACPLPEVA